MEHVAMTMNDFGGERDYWVPMDVHTDSDNMTTKIYATWQRAGRLYTVKTMRVVWENDEPQLYWSLRIASVKKPLHAEMTMVNVNQRTLTKHMVSSDTLAAFARTHGCCVTADDYDALVDALIAMDGVLADMDYWHAVSVLADDEDNEVNVDGPWVAIPQMWWTHALLEM